MIDLYPLLGPVLRALPPETAHRVSIRALAAGLVPRDRRADDPILSVDLWGRRLSNPIGVAAGFDKGAEVLKAVLDLGFGLVEAGTVTPRPQPGNPRPRLFRLPEDKAVINRFGFNSEGLAVAEARMARIPRAGRRGLIGANVGKNKDSEAAGPDYAAGVRRLAPYSDYLVANVSSPNTPGLRELQRREALLALLAEVETALAETVRGRMLHSNGVDVSSSEYFSLASRAIERVYGWMDEVAGRLSHQSRQADPGVPLGSLPGGMA